MQGSEGVVRASAWKASVSGLGKHPLNGCVLMSCGQVEQEWNDGVSTKRSGKNVVPGIHSFNKYDISNQPLSWAPDRHPAMVCAYRAARTLCGTGSGSGRPDQLEQIQMETRIWEYF